jgi:hypothetical protein
MLMSSLQKQSPKLLPSQTIAPSVGAASKSTTDDDLAIASKANEQTVHPGIETCRMFLSAQKVVRADISWKSKANKPNSEEAVFFIALVSSLLKGGKIR